jgi:hypothetical protein
VIREGLAKFDGQKLVQATFFEFVDECKRLLCPNDWQRRYQMPCFLDSLRYLAGQSPNMQMLDALAWRLAANEETIRGRIVPPWTHQRSNEWVYAQILWMSPKRGGKRSLDRGYDICFRVLTGSPAGLDIIQWWSLQRCLYMATRRDMQGRGFGFQRPRRNHPEILPKYPFLDPRQLVTLRCLLLLEPELSGQEPGFRTMCFNAGTTLYNQEQQKLRRRQEPGYGCPQGFPLTVPCHLCVFGYDQCRAGTHPKTFVNKVCGRCKEEGPHDPTDRFHKYCVNCLHSEVFGRKKSEEET